MELPMYFICGIKAVKFIETEDGGMTVLVYNKKNKTFEKNLNYLTIVFESNDSEEVSEDEFNEYIEKLKNE